MEMPETIRQGSTGAAVREAQYLLARDRYLTAPEIDGVFGPHTNTAVRGFQHDQGLGVDGIVGPQTWGKLLATHAFPPPTLAEGSTGSVVERLQQFLNNGRSDFDPGAAPLVVDGSYGPKTRAMVVAFQHWGGVPADGVVGLQTWAVGLHAAGQELGDLVGV
jgi:peptidoglycan hydrolase-like protein with peptidoglycan-binding domain